MITATAAQEAGAKVAPRMSEPSLLGELAGTDAGLYRSRLSRLASPQSYCLLHCGKESQDVRPLYARGIGAFLAQTRGPSFLNPRFYPAALKDCAPTSRFGREEGLTIFSLTSGGTPLLLSLILPLELKIARILLITLPRLFRRQSDRAVVGACYR
jgi:hypothetical protein